MNFQFANLPWLWLALPALAWVIWLWLTSDVQIGPVRRWTSLVLRLLVLVGLLLALAGLQWKRPLEGMNVYFALDRSDSVPSLQQEQARKWLNEAVKKKKETDRAGLVVFGTDASIESTALAALDVQKINAVVPTERTDLAAALRLATAAFPETGQRRIVLLSDGNENLGDAFGAAQAALTLGATIDVVPMGIERLHDVSVQKLSVPSNVKKGQSFEVKVFVNTDEPGPATVRLRRNDQYLGEQKIQLDAGKNLLTFPQTLDQPGFYAYDVTVEAPGDSLPQNNRAIGFAAVRGEPQILLVSSDPDADAQLAEALRSAQIQVRVVGPNGFPGTLAEMQSYDSIFISNIAAGDLGNDLMKLLEAAVRDFGVGLVCVGGDQTYAAGAYRGTPLEATLPVDMELDSKKVFPPGALVLVMHGMEFPGANEVARETALGALEALGPQDEMGVLLWNGTTDWLFELQKVGDKRRLGRLIAGMNQGDLMDFDDIMRRGYEALKKSTASLKHIVVFSDGDPGPPSDALMKQIVDAKITVSTVMIGGHVQPTTMQRIANIGKGNFYDVQSPAQLPQIFIKEASVVLKTAIIEEPFKPQMPSSTELVRGISDFPQLLGYVATSPKPRAELPLVTQQGDPLLAHWQYGLGRAVAFTSDAKAKWAKNWMGWGQYRQFWSQIGQWSMRRLENADFTTDVTIDKGEGRINVEALDEQSNFRNFLNLQAAVVGPKGNRETVRLEQTGPGRYEAHFPTRETGAYLLNLSELRDGKVVGSTVVGASVNYSPEFIDPEPNVNLLRRIADFTGGKVLDPRSPADNPFLHDRKKTFQPQDLWEWLLKFAVVLFVLDVGVRRVQLGREEWQRGMAVLRRAVFFWQKPTTLPPSDQSLSALLARRDQVRTTTQTTTPAIAPAELFRPLKIVPVPAPSIQEPTAPSAGPETPPVPPAATESTTSRLLEAKRRAKKN